MSELEQHKKDYSKAVVRLLKSPIERSSTLWETVLVYQTEIQDYISQIGLELVVKKDEGFAFVRQFTDSEGNTMGLITRRQIGFETSIVLVVLRQALEEFDSNPTQFQGTEKFISSQDIKEEVELFLPDKFNRVKFMKELDKYIGRIADLGYLREISQKETETVYQIHRIIKEKVTLDDLQAFKTKLEAYVESI